MAKIYISYTTTEVADSEFAERLKELVKTNGHEYLNERSPNPGQTQGDLSKAIFADAEIGLIVWSSQYEGSFAMRDLKTLQNSDTVNITFIGLRGAEPGEDIRKGAHFIKDSELKDLEIINPENQKNKRPGRPKSAISTKPVVQPETKIFLASSEELKEDRDEFELYFRQQNDKLRKKGIYLEVIRWENFLDAMSETSLQDEYNKEVRACDIFVSLFYKKAGSFTNKEFDVAHENFLTHGRPLIYTFFRKASIPIDDSIDPDVQSLMSFKKKLKKLRHFYTVYDGSNDLKLQFKDQLEILQDDGRL